MKLSVIGPIYNEEEIIEKFYKETIKELKNIDYELLFIDDGSTDNSLKKLKSICKNDNRVKIISFSRNFGKEAAIYAGIKNSCGEYVCIIDTDLQQEPKYIVSMYKFLTNNKEYDSVCMCQENNKGFFYKICQKTFYKTIDKLANIKFVNGASDFRMFNKRMKESLLELSEKNRFSKGLFSWVGYNTKYLNYKVKERTTGKSKFNFTKSFSYAIDGFVGFSTKPLRISTYVGSITSIVAFIYLIIILIQTLLLGKDTPGYASIMCVLLFLGGIQLICLGIIGEYLSKTYLETKQRPIYIEKERINLNDKA